MDPDLKLGQIVTNTKRVLSEAGIQRPKAAGDRFTHYDALVAALALAVRKEHRAQHLRGDVEQVAKAVSPSSFSRELDVQTWTSGIGSQYKVGDELRKRNPDADLRQLARALVKNNPALVVPDVDEIKGDLIFPTHQLKPSERENALHKLSAPPVTNQPAQVQKP